MLLRLAYLSMTNAFAALRLLPMSDRDRTPRSWCSATNSRSWSANCKESPAQQQHIAQADTDQSPPESRTIHCFRCSAWVQLRYHQETKNILTSYSPKKLGFF
ncbi:hypothetical protein [Streptomyces sp. NPDC057889]|uniref:hypothetical protein n=1 Tax=unclassified Streptomyces TaxID=2593676 RepID=UPI0036A292D7